MNSVLKAQIEEKAVAARRNGLAFLVVSLEVPEAFRHFKRVEVRPDIVTKEMAKKDMAFAICYATSEGVFARTFIPKVRNRGRSPKFLSLGRGHFSREQVS